MTDESRIKELLEDILDSHCTPEEACAMCPELLPEVRRRLERMRLVGDQIEMLFPSDELGSGIVEKPAPRPSRSELPRVDGYDVQGILGRGGMGIVYQARHLKLNRVVALKMLLAGPYASSHEVARFVRESRAVAELQHPHIVQVHEVGDLDGRPFFTMEFVEGGSLAQELAGAPQLAPRAAELVLTLAGAVHLAHTKGIIHRDLKPANILLTQDGLPKIADFGLARHVDGDPKLTMSDARVGTPSYMAPEQALGKLGTIGPSVDIYALGAILYEMLTGRPPFRAETAIETERQVITVEAVAPSRLNANVPRDLENICLKCLHKDPARRYSTAADLAADLRRFLDGKPVFARPVGWGERMWRWAVRNRAVAVALLSITILLVLIVVGAVWAAAYFRRLERDHRKLAQEKGDLADERGRLAAEKETERERAAQAEKRETRLHHQAALQAEELRRILYLTEMNLSGQAASIPSGLGRVKELLARWEEGSPDLRNWEWYYLSGLCHRSLQTRMPHAQIVYHLAWSPNGGRLASASADRTVCIWDTSDERPTLKLKGHDREVMAIAWSPDGQRLASASLDGTVRVWDTTSGTELFRAAGHTSEVFSVSWSPDGNLIASGGNDHTIRIWNVSDGTIRHILNGHEATVTGLTWCPDSTRLASGGRDAKICLWDVAMGKLVRTFVGHNNWVNEIAWSPDGSRLASASNDQTVRLWDPEKGVELLSIRGHSQGVTSVAWSSDCTRLTTTSYDQTVKVWSAATGAETFTLRGHLGPLTSVAWNPKQDRLASGGYDRMIKIWSASTGPETPALMAHDKPIQSVAWCPRGPKLFASSDAGGTIKIWDMAQQQVQATLLGDEHVVYSVAWHPGGTWLAAGDGNGAVRIWDVGSGKEPQVLKAHAGAVLSVAWSPDGRRLATGGLDKSIRIWDVASGKIIRVIESHQHSVYSVAWNSDGLRLVSASGDRTVKIWNVASGAEIVGYRGHKSEVISVEWSPDGTMLASAGFDQNVHLWDAATGNRKTILRGHTAHVAQVSWSSNATRLASAGRDGTVKVWDTNTGREALTLDGHASQVNAVAWSPDGMILVSAGEDHQIRIHDATAGYLEARASQLLPAIDRRLIADSARSSDWRLRAEIYARNHNWDQAAIDARQYLLLKPHPTWFIPGCLSAGPYPAGLSGRHPPEDANIFADKLSHLDDSGHATGINWRVVPYSSQGILDFGAITEYRDYVSAYALFPIYSLDEQDVAILVGTDDQARLWLNGERLYESLRSRMATPDEDAISAKLKSGWNTLLVRVANETGEHALFLRLSDSAADLARARAGAK
jgi:WD40 repeat protein